MGELVGRGVDRCLVVIKEIRIGRVENEMNGNTKEETIPPFSIHLTSRPPRIPRALHLPPIEQAGKTALGPGVPQSTPVSDETPAKAFAKTSSNPRQTPQEDPRRPHLPYRTPPGDVPGRPRRGWSKVERVMADGGVVLIGLPSPPSENPVGHGGTKIPQRLHSAAVFGSSEAELMRYRQSSRHIASSLTMPSMLAGNVASLAQRCPSDPMIVSALGVWFLRILV